MALEINNLKQPAVGAMYVAPERIYVTADGELCGEDDARGVRLLVAKGCEIPAYEAAQYGLIAEVVEEAPSEDAPTNAPEIPTVEIPKGRKK